MASEAAEIGVNERRAEVNGISLHVREAGEGPPVVLLHGWPQHGLVWRHLLPRLAARYRVIAPDLRGFGRSDAPPGDYRKHVFVEDLLALLDAEGIERTALVGHDWGGWTAWLTALEHPDRVERFVGIDIPPPWLARQSPRRFAKQLAFASYQFAISTPLVGRRLVQRVARQAFLRGSSHGMRWSDEDLAAYLEPLREPARARMTVRLYRTFLTRELLEINRGTYTRRELTVPGLAIMGARSPITRLVWDPAPGPNFEVEVIEGAGHFVPEERPDEVGALVERFLAAGEPRG